MWAICEISRAALILLWFGWNENRAIEIGGEIEREITRERESEREREERDRHTDGERERGEREKVAQRKGRGR